MADLPPPLAQTLQSMQGHMEIMARTVQLLERRLATTERQLADMRDELLRSSRAPAEEDRCSAGAAAWPALLQAAAPARATQAGAAWVAPSPAAGTLPTARPCL